MSTDTEQAKANAKSSHPRGGPADHDLDHSPAAAHKTSKAGLNKAESAAQLTTSSVQERTEQRNNSKQSNIEGFEGSILVAAKEIIDHSARVEAFAHGRQTDAGDGPLRQEIEQGAATIDKRVRELEMNMSAAKNGGMDMQPLRHAMQVFQRAHTQFINACAGAGHQIGPDHGLKHNLFRLVGLADKDDNHEAPDQSVTSEMSMLRNSKQSDVSSQAINVMARAAVESVRLARMSVSGVRNDTRIHDLKRATADLRELAALVTSADDKTKRQHRAALHEIIRDSRTLFAEERSTALEHDNDEDRSTAQAAEFKQLIEGGNSTEPGITKIEQATR
jgi:hypothetical protein